MVCPIFRQVRSPLVMRHFLPQIAGMTYRTVNDWLTDPDLSTAERKLIDAARAGRRCILQYPLKKVPDGPNDAHNVRADLLSLLITGGTKDCGLSNFGVTLVGAYITGRLRLTHQAAVGDTSLFYCRFADSFLAWGPH